MDTIEKLKGSGTSFNSLLMFPDLFNNFLSSEIYQLVNFNVLTQIRRIVYYSKNCTHLFMQDV